MEIHINTGAGQCRFPSVKIAVKIAAEIIFEIASDIRNLFCNKFHTTFTNLLVYLKKNVVQLT